MSPRFPIFASSSEARTATLQSLLIAAIVITGLMLRARCFFRSLSPFC